MIVDGSPQQNNGELQFDGDDDDGSDNLEKYDLNFSQDSPNVITLSSKETLLADSNGEGPAKELTSEESKVEKSWSVLIITIVIGIVFLSLNLLVFGATFVQWYVISQRFKKGLCKSQNLSETNKSTESHPGIKPECSIDGGGIERTPSRLNHQVDLNVFKTGFRPSFNLSEALNHGFNFFPNSNNGTSSLLDDDNKLQALHAQKPSPSTSPLSSHPWSKCSTMKDLLPPNNNPSERHRLTVRFSVNDQQPQQSSDLRQLTVRSDTHSEENQVESRLLSSSGVEPLRTDGQNSDGNHQHISAHSTQVSRCGTIVPLESCPQGSIPGDGHIVKSPLSLVKGLHKNVSTTVWTSNCFQFANSEPDSDRIVFFRGTWFDVWMLFSWRKEAFLIFKKEINLKLYSNALLFKNMAGYKYCNIESFE